MATAFPSKNKTQQRRVLLVEDHTTLRQLWVEMLRLHGYETDMAANGREGLDKIAEHAYDAIVSDVHMPVLNGQEMFDACRLQFPEAANRIIFITGGWFADSEEMCKGTGRPYLLKSFAWEHLHRTLQEVFDANDAAVATPVEQHS